MDSTLEKLVAIETKLDMISKILGLEKESIIEKTKRYFELFSTKNVKGLENEMYSDDIHLRDWNGEWKGKQAVLEMNESVTKFLEEFGVPSYREMLKQEKMREEMMRQQDSANKKKTIAVPPSIGQ
jgi:hypothetical protein